MLINVRLLFQGGGILWVVGCIVVFGTLGKALAAYIAAYLFRLPRTSGHMMFGLTSAHAACAIAMVIVGMGLHTADGHLLIDEGMLNGIVIMILFTCIISSLVTDWAARRITLRDKLMPSENLPDDDEKILVPVKYKEYANRLMSMAIMARNPKLHVEGHDGAGELRGAGHDGHAYQTVGVLLVFHRHQYLLVVICVVLRRHQPVAERDALCRPVGDQRGDDAGEEDHDDNAVEHVLVDERTAAGRAHASSPRWSPTGRHSASRSATG